MDDAPVPYAEIIEKEVVKRESDLIEGVFFDLCTQKW